MDSEEKREKVLYHLQPCMHACMRILIPMLLQITIQKIELVKGMGVLIKSSSLAMILRRSKRTPTRLLRFLMDEHKNSGGYCTSWAISP